MENWKRKTIVIAVHESIPSSPAHELRNFFLATPAKRLDFLTHPLLYFSEGYEKSSSHTVYKNGKPVRTSTSPVWKLPEAFLYVKDILYTLVWCYHIPGNIDYYFGVNPLNALCGVLLKKMGKVKKVVYYNIDYTPKRFPNSILNTIFHTIEKYCCYTVDVNWVGTKRTVDARIENGINIDRCAKTVIIPDGNHSHSIKTPLKKDIDRFSLVYLGSIDKKQGIDLILDSWTKIQKVNKRISLVIIGKGDYLSHVKNKIKNLRLTNIELKGYVEDDREIESILVHSGVGLAPYMEDRNSFTYFSEAGKPKFYLGCGLPVIVTRVPEIAGTIERRKAGIAISYDTHEFLNAIYKIVGDEDTYITYRKNARKLGKMYDWEILFSSALAETII